MTIITKISESKAKKLKEPLFADEPADGVPKADVESGVEPRFVILGSRARRVSTATTVCLFLTALLVMSIGIIGGMYLYRQFARSQTHFHGWCTVPYSYYKHGLAKVESVVPEEEYSPIFGYQRQKKHTPFTGSFNSFEQEFEIDLENENFEKIFVPDFEKGRRGRFIHDFSANKTGIIDLNEQRCFVMPLNRARVLPPHSMFDLVEKMSHGYYEVDTGFVRDSMRVVTPAITDLKDIGQYIAQECKNLKTYLLVKEDKVSGISKRSIPSNKLIFAEFAGKKITEFYIDISALDEHENGEAAEI